MRQREEIVETEEMRKLGAPKNRGWVAGRQRGEQRKQIERDQNMEQTVKRNYS